jgi:hypothetical protein
LQYFLYGRSIDCMTRGELTYGQAMELLDAWGKWHARRDEIVRAAVGARVTVAEIHQLTGLARTTIKAILDDTPAAERRTRNS